MLISLTSRVWQVLWHLLCVWHKEFIWKWFYTQFMLPLNTLENSGNSCHGFRSFWLTGIIWLHWRCTCLWILRPALKVSASLKKIVDLHMSGLSFGTICNWLKVHHSSEHKIIQRYKHHRTKQPSNCEGKYTLSVSFASAYLSVQSVNQEQQQGPCEDVGGNGHKHICIHS